MMLFFIFDAFHFKIALQTGFYYFQIRVRFKIRKIMNLKWI